MSANSAHLSADLAHLLAVSVYLSADSAHMSADTAYLSGRYTSNTCHVPIPGIWLVVNVLVDQYIGLNPNLVTIPDTAFFHDVHVAHFMIGNDLFLEGFPNLFKY